MPLVLVSLCNDSVTEMPLVKLSIPNPDPDPESSHNSTHNLDHDSNYNPVSMVSGSGVILPKVGVRVRVRRRVGVRVRVRVRAMIRL